MDLLVLWLTSKGWLVCLTIFNIALMCLCIWRQQRVERLARQAHFLATGSRERAVNAYREASRATGEVRRITGEHPSVECINGEQCEVDLDDTQIKEKSRSRSTKKKKRR